MMMIPVSCRHNTWSPLHACPRRNTHEVRLGSRGPSTPHFVGVLLGLESKAKREDKIKDKVNSRQIQSRFRDRKAGSEPQLYCY